MRYIDFRSDTVTKPTPEMRKAMYEAEVGDDVLGDDPTVKRLESLAAEIFKKEAALFFPSGSMANATAVKVHTNEGDEIIVEERNHIYLMEMGHLSFISRVKFGYRCHGKEHKENQKILCTENFLGVLGEYSQLLGWKYR